MSKKSDVLERLRKRITLKTKLRVAFQMHDYENWHNGDYSGDAEKYVDIAIDTVNEHDKSLNTIHTTDATFCCTLSVERMERTNIFKTIIDIESGAFSNVEFSKELMALLAKYCP